MEYFRGFTKVLQHGLQNFKDIRINNIEKEEISSVLVIGKQLAFIMRERKRERRRRRD